MPRRDYNLHQLRALLFSAEQRTKRALTIAKRFDIGSEHHRLAMKSVFLLEDAAFMLRQMLEAHESQHSDSATWVDPAVPRLCAWSPRRRDNA